MAFFRRRSYSSESLQEKIEIEIRERVIRRERELREDKERRLREQSNIEALQEITEFVPDAEVTKIANEVTRQWEEKGSIAGKEDRIESEIREKVIEREREIGLQKEQIQKEKSHLKALQEVTDYVTDEEIQRISREVQEKYQPKPKTPKRKTTKSKPQISKGRKGDISKKKSEEDSKTKTISTKTKDFITLLVLLLISFFFRDNLASVGVYLLLILPACVYLILKNFIKLNEKVGLFSVFVFWGLPWLIISCPVYHTLNDSWTWTDYDAANELIYLIAEGDVERVKSLIDNGAKINVNQAYNYTPLMAAAGHGNLEIVKFLVENGVHLNPTTHDEETALMFAVKNGHMEVVYYLAAQGARTNQTDVNGEDALFYAVKGGNLELTKYLVEQGADLNKKDSWDRNILTWAVYNRQPEIVRYFRKEGLQFERWSQKERIPGITEEMIYEALSCNVYNLAYFLAISGDTKDFKELDNVAQEACQCDMEEVYKILVELGARDECEFGE